MKIDTFLPKNEILEIIKILDIDALTVKRIRQFSAKELFIKFEDGHSAIFKISKGENKNAKNNSRI